jgi:voltage-gated potassium channel
VNMHVAHSTTELFDHYIICGYGRVGREVAAGLRRRHRVVVTIDREAHGDSDATPALTGDATDDAVLSKAGIARARGLVAGTGSDAANLAIVLSARALNAGLLVVARANQPEAEPKLLRAGASRVVSPYAIGAHRMATQLISPGIAEFLDAIRDEDRVDLWIEEVRVGAGSALVGGRIGDRLPRAPGALNLIALRRGTGVRPILTPSADAHLQAGDILIVVGSRAHLRQLMAQAMGPDHSAPVPAS